MAAPLNVFRGQRPDITPAQILGAVAAAVGPACQLIGVELSPEELKAVDDLTVIGLGLIGADAALRIGRNMKDGRVEAAALAAPAAPPLGPPPAGVDEAPLEASEIESLGVEIGTDDLDDHALAIAEEELVDVPEDEQP